MTSAAQLLDVVRAVRDRRPLVHCLTNAVTVGRVADALAAFGACPVMASAPEEAPDMVEQAQALLLNLGTPTLERWTVARLTAQRAHARGIPIVVDPVGCGATPWRTEQTRLLLDAVRVDVARGSAPEIAALGRIPAPGAHLRGVAAENSADIDTAALARDASRALGCTVVVTGAVDAISDGRRTLRHLTGVPLLERVVGAGDVLTALIAACRGVETDSVAASLAGLAAFTTAAQASHSEGPGSFWIHLLDALSTSMVQVPVELFPLEVIEHQ